jgi:MOSC domain-containing protein YiiM
MGTLAGIARRDGKRGEMQELDSAEVTTETGVANDFRGRPGKRQVTVLAAEAWGRACADVGRELPWVTRRANLLVEGVELPQTAGAVIVIGDLRLEVVLETDPCSRMDEQCPGLREALVPDWRGGVCCRVLSSGRIAIGDEVRIAAAATRSP